MCQAEEHGCSCDAIAEQEQRADVDEQLMMEYERQEYEGEWKYDQPLMTSDSRFSWSMEFDIDPSGAKQLLYAIFGHEIIEGFRAEQLARQVWENEGGAYVERD